MIQLALNLKFTLYTKHLEPSLTTLKPIEPLKIKSQKQRKEHYLVGRWQVCRKLLYYLQYSQIYGGGLRLAQHWHSLCAHKRKYSNIMSTLKALQSRESSTYYLYYCCNHLHAVRADGCCAHTVALATLHTQSVQGSQSLTLKLTERLINQLKLSSKLSIFKI